jgi:hypothetical protein
MLGARVFGWKRGFLAGIVRWELKGTDPAIYCEITLQAASRF